MYWVDVASVKGVPRKVYFDPAEYKKNKSRIIAWGWMTESTVPVSCGDAGPGVLGCDCGWRASLSDGFSVPAVRLHVLTGAKHRPT